MKFSLDHDMSLSRYYWPFQAIGWIGFLSVYVIFLLPNNRLSAEGIESADRLIIVGVYISLLGLIGSHLLRIWFNRENWIELSVLEFWKRAIAATYIVALGASILELPILTVLDFLLPPPESLEDAFENLGPIASSLPFRVFRSSLFMWVLFLAWGGVYWGIITWNSSRAMRFRNDSLLMEQKVAELKLLTQQLNPHFLFNSLNNIRALIFIDQDRAAEMVSSLSSMLRSTLEQQYDLIALKDEVSIVTDYLELEKVRLGDRLRVFEEWDEKTLDYKVPPMLMQTLIENAIKHGISDKVEGGELHIGSKLEDDGVVIRIRNDGKLDQKAKGLGIGLENCRERLRLLFEGKARLEIYQVDGSVNTDLFVPRISLGDDS